MAQFNELLVSRLERVKELWREDAPKRHPDYEEGEYRAGIGLNRHVKPGFTGRVSYSARFERHLSEDVGIYDDFIVLKIDPTVVTVDRRFVDLVARLIEVFEAYRATFQTDRSVGLDDFETWTEQSRRGRLVRDERDSRDGVYRLWPIVYMDELLCQRGFGIGAAEVVRRATPVCERAELLNGGAYLVATADIVTGSALDDLDARLRDAIDPEQRTARPRRIIPPPHAPAAAAPDGAEAGPHRRP